MNILKKIYCRSYQFAFRCVLPVLPYRQPTRLNSNKELVDVLKLNNVSKVLLVTDKGISNLGLTKPLEFEIENNGINLYMYDDTQANPTSSNVEDALQIYKANNCTAIIAFGGGSAMDCAKAVGVRIARPKNTLSELKGVLKVRKKLPLLIAIPTTAGTGSETTLASVITDSTTRLKYAINDFPLIPKYALLDASLTLGLPRSLTSTTGMDALTHAVEAYIGQSLTKQTKKYSLMAIKLIFENILEVYENGSNIKARENMLTASYFAGIAFTKSYVGYVHAIAHSLGGKYNVAHGLANAVILPVVLKKYGKSVYKKLYQIGSYCNLFSNKTDLETGAKMVISKIEQLNAKMNIPSNIDCIDNKDIPSLAKTAEKEANPLYPVPKLFTAKELAQVYYDISINK